MIQKIFSSIFGYGAGVFSMVYLPERNGGSILELVSNMIIEPIDFLIGVFFFFISFIFLSKLISSLITEIFLKVKKYNVSIISLLFSFICIGVFPALFLVNMDMALLLFLFTLTYGIISVDINEKALKSKIN